MFFQQTGDRKRRKARHEGLVRNLGVTPVHNRANDAGIGTGPTNPLAFQHFHQRRFGVACRRLGFVAHCIEVLASRGIANSQNWQDNFSILNRGIGIVRPFDISPEEARKVNPFASGAEASIFHVNLDGDVGLAGIGHLRGHGALPNQVVQRQLPPRQARLLGRTETAPGWADGFVGFLRSLAFGGVLTWLGAEVVSSVFVLDAAPSSGNGLLRQVNRVGSHVGDVALFVQTLSRAHGVPRGES